MVASAMHTLPATRVGQAPLCSINAQIGWLTRTRTCRLRARATADKQQQQQQQQQQDRGTSGLNVEGNRPTSAKAWDIMVETLRENNVQFMTPDQLIAAAEFKDGFIDGAVNVPLFQPIAGWSALQVARRAGFALFGVLNGTEPNPCFLEEVLAEAPDTEEARPILVCSQGGSLVSPSGSAKRRGVQSRSLMAAYKLVGEGYRGVAVLDGGMSAWLREEREIVVYAEDEE